MGKFARPAKDPTASTRLLCPIDFSDHSMRALERAAAIGRWYESEVTLLHVAPVVPAAYAPGTPMAPPAVCAPAAFSDAATHALDYALPLAQEADAALTMLHVVEVPAELIVELPARAEGRSRTLAGYVAAVTGDRRARLEAAVPDAVRTYCRVTTAVVAGKPYQVILRMAAEEQSDRIVIGLHGRGATHLLFFGSTTQHVVRDATCPVLTLRRG